MLACPRCGNDAEYLPDDVWTLIHCEFCGENLDDADVMLRATLDRMTQTPPPPPEELLSPFELSPSDQTSARAGTSMPGSEVGEHGSAMDLIRERGRGCLHAPQHPQRLQPPGLPDRFGPGPTTPPPVRSLRQAGRGWRGSHRGGQ
jgi:hypothetical protein